VHTFDVTQTPKTRYLVAWHELTTRAITLTSGYGYSTLVDIFIICNVYILAFTIP